LREEENARETKQKQEESNASIPLEWNQEDYDRLEELTLELLEPREQHECVREVVENHNKDIEKVKRSIASLTNKYTKYKDVLVANDPKVIKMEKQLSTYYRAYLRLLLRLRCKIDEAHRKLATYLCRNVRFVLLPKFETSRMVKNADRNISAVTARKMMNWGHYRFRRC